LGWRLKSYFNIDTSAYKSHLRESISSGLNEIHAPLICIRQYDKEFIGKLMDKAESLEANIVKEILLDKYKETS